MRLSIFATALLLGTAAAIPIRFQSTVMRRAPPTLGSCTAFKECGTCVVSKGQGSFRKPYKCIFDTVAEECHSEKTSRKTEPQWTSHASDCAMRVAITKGGLKAHFAEFAVMDVVSFSGNVKDQTQVPALKKRAEDKVLDAMYNAAAQSFALKLGTSIDHDAMMKAGKRFDDAKAAVCTTFAAAAYYQLATNYADNLERIEVVANGPPSQSGSHIYLVVNRVGADVTKGSDLPAVDTWTGGFLVDGWGAGLGHPVMYQTPLDAVAHGTPRLVYEHKFKDSSSAAPPSTVEPSS